MAKLPGYTPQGSVDTGANFMRPVQPSNDTARAVGRLAATIGNIADARADEEEATANKARALADQDQKWEAQRKLINFESTIKSKLMSDAENMPENGRGFFDTYRKAVDEETNKFLDQLPPELRGEYEVRAVNVTSSALQGAAAMQSQARRDFLGNLVKDRSTSLTTAVTSGGDVNAARADADDFVSQLNLPTNADAALRRQLGLSLDLARIERIRQESPVTAYRELRKYVTGVPKSSDPHVNLVIDAAERHNIPVDLALTLVEGESGFNPTSQAKTSSAFGLFQLIDGNWQETGIEKTSDPALQAEAGARLLRKRIDQLTDLGVPVNAANLWGMHFQGPAGYPALLKADRNAPIEEVIGRFYSRESWAKATSGNGSLMRPGMTAGQLIDNIKAYTDRNAERVQSRLDVPAGIPDAGQVMIGDEPMQYLTGDKVASLYEQAKQSVTKASDDGLKELERSKATSFLDGSRAFDPGDSGERGAVDRVYEETDVRQRMLAGEPEAFSTAIRDTLNLQYIPKAAANAAVQAITRGASDDAGVQSYEFLAGIQKNSPVATRYSEIPKDIENKVTLYRALTEDLRFSATDALDRIREITSPEYQKILRMTLDEEGMKKAKQELSVRDIEKFVDTFVTFEPKVNPKAVGAIMGSYERLFEYYVAQTGDPAEAKTAALKQLSTVVGVSSVFGRNELMMYPPEQVLPTAGTEKTFWHKGGSHQWVADQAQRTLEAYVGEPPAKEDIFLVPNARTAEDVRMGSKEVSYMLAYRNSKTGMIEMFPEQFVPNYGAAVAMARDEFLAASAKREAEAAEAMKGTGIGRPLTTEEAQRRDEFVDAVGDAIKKPFAPLFDIEERMKPRKFTDEEIYGKPKAP